MTGQIDPRVAPPNVYDGMRWREAIRRVQHLRDDEIAPIVCGREPSQLDDLMLGPDCKRFTQP